MVDTVDRHHPVLNPVDVLLVKGLELASDLTLEGALFKIAWAGRVGASLVDSPVLNFVNW